MIPILLAFGAATLLIHSLVEDDEDLGLPKRRIFISHSWRHSSRDYSNFISKLKFKEDFYNHSIPHTKAFLEWEPDKLRIIFRKQMSGCQKVFVLAHSKLKKESYVGIELEIAAEMGKEVIAIKPYGQQKVPNFIKQYSNRIIANNIASITKEFHS